MQVFRSLIVFVYTSLTLCVADQSSDLGSIWDQLDHCPSCANLFTCVDKDEPENEPKGGLAESWETDVYKVERRQIIENGECTEEIKVFWKSDTKHVKTFNPKCLESGSLRPEHHGNAVLIIGGPTKKFFLFSSQRDEFFYKENDNWIKGSFNQGEKEEFPMTSDEISRVKDILYEKWRVVTEAYNQKTKNVDNLIIEEEERHEKEVKRFATSTEEEDERYKVEQLALTCKKDSDPKSVKGGMFKEDKCKAAQKNHELILKKIEIELKKENENHEKKNQKLTKQLAQLKKQFDKEYENLKKKKF